MLFARVEEVDEASNKRRKAEVDVVQKCGSRRHAVTIAVNGHPHSRFIVLNKMIDVTNEMGCRNRHIAETRRVEIIFLGWVEIMVDCGVGNASISEDLLSGGICLIDRLDKLIFPYQASSYNSCIFSYRFKPLFQ